MKKKTASVARMRPLDWQTDPSRVTSDRVQYWREGTMRSAMMTREAAQEAIRCGTAFVISSQAIGALADGYYNS